jgi:hypothetical protein
MQASVHIFRSKEGEPFQPWHAFTARDLQVLPTELPPEVAEILCHAKADPLCIPREVNAADGYRYRLVYDY